MNEYESAGKTFADYLRVLRRHRRLIAATTATVLLMSLLVTALMRPQYEAKSKVAVEPVADRDDLERILFGGAELGTQEEIMTSPLLVREVMEANGLPTSDEFVKEFIDGQLTVETIEGATVLEVTVTNRLPDRAATLAQGVAEQYLLYLERDADSRLLEATADLTTQEETTRQRLRSVQEQLAANPGATQQSLIEERDELYAQLRFIATRRAELQTTSAFARRGDIIQPATVPRAPVSPKPVLNGLLGLLAGVLLGAGLAFLREFTDERVRTDETLDPDGGGPLLAVVSSPPGTKEPVVLHDPAGVEAEGYRHLRLRYTSGAKPRTVSTSARNAHHAVVMPATRDGDAGLVAANLALMLARSGRSVLLLDADVQRGTASKLLGVTGPGVAEVLAGQPLAGPSISRASRNLAIIGAGVHSGFPGERLASDDLPQLLARHDDHVNDVLIVVPASLRVPEALDVAARADAVLLVADDGARLDELRLRAYEVTEVGGSIAGTVVVCRAPGRRKRLDGNAAAVLPTASVPDGAVQPSAAVR